ncbi:hypothetical protein NKG94_16655 [Micromonospora sp. M12]
MYEGDSSTGLALRIRSGVQYTSIAASAVTCAPYRCLPAAHASALTAVPT